MHCTDDISWPPAKHWRLRSLRRRLIGLDPTLAPGLAEPAGALPLGVAAMDRSLGGGLSRGALHELVPTAPADLGAATGFAWVLATLAGTARGEVLWIATDLAGVRAGRPYGLGLDAFGLAVSRLVTLSVPCPVDVLWAMEEALHCRAFVAVIAELTDAAADLTQTRRLTLAARSGNSFGILLRHHSTRESSAAATRWQIATGRSQPDRFGGLGPPAFDLSLVKNRRGPAGRWSVTWDRHECVFRETVSLGMAEAAFDRSDRTSARRAG